MPVASLPPIVTNTPIAPLGKPKKILIATYYFPPDSAVGGKRAAKYARCLREFGWKPYVLTVEDRHREHLDPEGLRGLDGITIVKVGRGRGIVQRCSRLIARLRRRPLVQPEERKPAPGPSHAPESGGARIKRYLISLVQFLPDDKKSWAWRASLATIRLLRTERIDYIMTSSPPYSGHLVGLVARLFTGAIWIADFRDPWIDVLADRPPFLRSQLSDRLERWMEWLVLKCSDCVVSTTERLRDALKARYPRLPPEKFVCLPNSIDTGTFAASDCVEKYDRLTITYTGDMYFGRTPEPLFRAVSELIREGHISPSDVTIKLVGECRFIDGVDTGSVARKYGLGSVVEVLERVPYSEAVNIMKRSHLLLALAPASHRLNVGAKTFDYLGSGSKILALAEEGATADLVNQTGGGRCFSHADVLGLQDYLVALIADGRYKQLKNRTELFHAYEAKQITRRLMGVISELQ